MKRLKVGEFEIEINNEGAITFRDIDSEIFIGTASGRRFEVLESALKVAREMKYLASLEEISE